MKYLSITFSLISSLACISNYSIVITMFPSSTLSLVVITSSNKGGLVTPKVANYFLFAPMKPLELGLHVPSKKLERPSQLVQSIKANIKCTHACQTTSSKKVASFHTYVPKNFHQKSYRLVSHVINLLTLHSPTLKHHMSVYLTNMA